jgi:P27 family predicted phage terminase small subunit
MSLPGRKPDPNALKLIKGNPGRRPIKPSPQPTPVAPEPPSWLDAEARKKWKELAPELEKVGLLTAVDGATFAMMLVHYSLAVEAVRELKRIRRELRKDGKKQHPLLATDEMKMPRKHPLHQILRDHSSAFKAYMPEFGLSPSSRSRLSIQEPEGEEDFF